MSAYAEEVLIRLLSDDASLEFLARDGLNTRVMPTEALRDVLDWSLRYRTIGGRAPTIGALLERFTGDFFQDNDIDLEDTDLKPDETIEWAAEELRSDFVRFNGGQFATRIAEAVAVAAPQDRVQVLGEMSAELAALVQDVSPQRTRVDLRRGGALLWEDYQRTVDRGGAPEGLLFGLPEFDAYTHGIHPGELALLAAPPKMGKSFALDFVAEKEWERERIAALFTLENSIEMTQMRIACMALQISIEELQNGTLDADDTEKLRWWVHDVLEKSEVPLHIFTPEQGMRTPQSMIQQAKAVGADSLIIDQLTFMEALKGRSREAQHEEVGRICHHLKAGISTGRGQIPCLMAHQINRDGTEYAEKNGKLKAGHMANSAETERTGDWTFGLLASIAQQAIHHMELQTLAARRVKPKDFELLWFIEFGRISVKREIVEQR